MGWDGSMDSFSFSFIFWKYWMIYYYVTPCCFFIYLVYLGFYGLCVVLCFLVLCDRYYP